MDPLDFTYGQIIAMVESRQSTDWDHTASTIATTLNVNRTKNAKPVSPDEIHPMRKSRSGVKLNKNNIHLLKSLAKS